MAVTQLTPQVEISGFQYSDSNDGTQNPSIGPNGVVSLKFLSDNAASSLRISDLLDYLDSNSKGLGDYYSPFPGTQVHARSIVPVSNSDNTQFVVSFTLGPRRYVVNGFTYSFDTSVSGAQSNLDKNEALITVGTDTISNDSTPSSATGGAITKVPKTTVMVDRLVPASTFTANGTIRVTPPISVGNHPYQIARGLVGKLNDAPLSIEEGVLSFAVQTVMLTGLQIQSPTIMSDDTLVFNVNYSFEYRPILATANGWWATVVAYDPKTGKPYRNIETPFPIGPSASSANGANRAAVNYELYAAGDFSVLGLT